ncbi:hypothetical protein LTR53_015502 [Teratosphaeriaceae sp. CCFEE 6253]|nr:hypothetical protein LTR53_015502 [Teratosphaeriaceae sp. CCFEE 6253]
MSERGGDLIEPSDLDSRTTTPPAMSVIWESDSDEARSLCTPDKSAVDEDLSTRLAHAIREIRDLRSQVFQAMRLPEGNAGNAVEPENWLAVRSMHFSHPSELDFVQPGDDKDIVLHVTDHHNGDKQTFYVRSAKVRDTCRALFGLRTAHLMSRTLDEGSARAASEYHMDGEPSAVSACLEYAYHGQCTNRTGMADLLFLLPVARQAREWYMDELAEDYCDIPGRVARLSTHDPGLIATALAAACKPPYQPHVAPWYEVDSGLVCNLYDAAAAFGYELLHDPENIELLSSAPGAMAHLAKHLARRLEHDQPKHIVRYYDRCHHATAIPDDAPTYTDGADATNTHHYTGYEEDMLSSRGVYEGEGEHSSQGHRDEPYGVYHGPHGPSDGPWVSPGAQYSHFGGPRGFHDAPYGRFGGPRGFHDAPYGHFGSP